MIDNYYWKPIGGHVALDLCNTWAWRRDPAQAIDRLASPKDFTRWYTDVVDQSEGRLIALSLSRDADQLDGELAGIHHLRDVLIAWLDAHIEGHSQREAAQNFAVLWRMSAARATTAPTLPLRWQIDVTDLRSAKDYLTLSAAELLNGDLGNLRRCAQPACGWLFLDRTRNHSRRWCTADDCGNLSRVRAYAERQRRAGQLTGETDT